MLPMPETTNRDTKPFKIDSTLRLAHTTTMPPKAELRLLESIKNIRHRPGPFAAAVARRVVHLASREGSGEPGEAQLPVGSPAVDPPCQPRLEKVGTNR
jgi:hypothetical protein